MALAALPARGRLDRPDEDAVPGRLVLAVLLFACTLTVMAGAVISPVLAVIRDDLGVSGTRGQLTALSGAAVFLGQFASPLLLGPLADATSITTGFLAAGGLALTVLLVLLCSRAGAPGAAQADRPPLSDRVVEMLRDPAAHS